MVARVEGPPQRANFVKILSNHDLRLQGGIDVGIPTKKRLHNGGEWKQRREFLDFIETSALTAIKG